MRCYFQERFDSVKYAAATRGFCYSISFQPKIHDLRFNLQGKISFTEFEIPRDRRAHEKKNVCRNIIKKMCTGKQEKLSIEPHNIIAPNYTFFHNFTRTIILSKIKMNVKIHGSFCLPFLCPMMLCEEASLE